MYKYVFYVSTFLIKYLIFFDQNISYYFNYHFMILISSLLINKCNTFKILT